MLHALLATVRLSRKNSSGANVLAYFGAVSVTNEEKFLALAPGRLGEGHA
jgi:hypothetical protein